MAVAIETAALHTKQPICIYMAYRQNMHGHSGIIDVKLTDINVNHIFYHTANCGSQLFIAQVSLSRMQSILYSFHFIR